MKFNLFLSQFLANVQNSWNKNMSRDLGSFISPNKLTTWNSLFQPARINQSAYISSADLHRLHRKFAINSYSYSLPRVINDEGAPASFCNLSLSALSLSESNIKSPLLPTTPTYIYQSRENNNYDLKTPEFRNHFNSSPSPMSIDSDERSVASSTHNSFFNSPMETESALENKNKAVMNWTRPAVSPPSLRVLKKSGGESLSLLGVDKAVIYDQPGLYCDNMCDSTSHSLPICGISNLAKDSSFKRKNKERRKMWQFSKLCTCLKKSFYCQFFLLVTSLVLAWLVASCNFVVFDSNEHKYDVSKTLDNLSIELQKQVFGQHIAISIIMKRLSEYLTKNNVESVQRTPLIFSFVGPVGIGKTFTSQIVSKIISPQEDCRNVFLYTAHHSLLKPLHDFIRSCTFNCHTCVVVLDDMNNVSKTETLKVEMTFAKMTLQANANCVVMLLSTIESQLLYDYLLNVKTLGKNREGLAISQILRTLRYDEMNSDNQTSFGNKTIVPFLPLERDHVVQCLQSAWNNMYHNIPFDYKIENDVLKEVVFHPAQDEYFAVAGCRDIVEKLNLL